MEIASEPFAELCRGNRVLFNRELLPGSARVQPVRSAPRDHNPLFQGWGASACTQYDRAYIRHLFAAEEMLGLRLVALHNVTFLIQLMAQARTALRAGDFPGWSRAWLQRYRERSARSAP